MVTICDAQTQTSFQLDISECNTADDIKQLIYVCHALLFVPFHVYLAKKWC